MSPPRALHLSAVVALVPTALAPRPAAADSATEAAAPASKGPQIEVAFVLDATGSMGPYINEARRRIASIAEDIAVGSPPPRVRYALVAYRDRGDEFVTRVHRFADSIDEMRRRLDATRADGGGDTPEAVLEGVDAAIRQLGWSEGDEVLRLIYLVGDAPAKSYGLTPAGVAAEARRRGIVIHTIACGGGSLPEFDAMARLSEGRALLLRDAHAAAVARARARGDRRGGAGEGGGGRGGLAEAITSTARAYSSSVGVDYAGGAARPISYEPLAAPAPERSGLLGSHVRWIRDPVAWADLWAAHTSLMPESERPAPPAIDFARQHVLVLGGAGAGLAVEAVEELEGGLRRARVRPEPGGAPRFLIVPASPAEGGAR